MKYYPRWKPGAPCPNKEAVICPDRSKCSKCGWDPEVAKKRLDAVKEELQQKARGKT